METAAKRWARLKENKGESPSVEIEPPLLSLHKFFEDSPPAAQEKPILPGVLAPYHFLYALSRRGAIRLPESTAILETIDEAADIVEGNLTGRVWQETLTEHLAALGAWEVWYLSGATDSPEPIDLELEAYFQEAA